MVANVRHPAKGDDAAGCVGIVRVLLWERDGWLPAPAIGFRRTLELFALRARESPRPAARPERNAVSWGALLVSSTLSVFSPQLSVARLSVL